MNGIARLLEHLRDRGSVRRYYRDHDRAVKRWLASDAYARIKACKHESTRLNHDSCSRDGWAQGEICNDDCGIGIVRRTKPLIIKSEHGPELFTLDEG